jgi:hypothetical protein
VRFSRRAPGDFTPNLLSRLAAERRRAGARLLDLTKTNPTRLDLPRPEVAPGAGAQARGLPYEPHPLGAAGARQAVARYFTERGLPAEADRILLTASTSEAYVHLFRVLADPGDELLVPAPSYPLFEPLARLEAVQLTAYPLRLDRETWVPDLEELARRIGRRTRAILAVQPGNPTGSLFTPEDAERLEALCAERGLALVADEVFADFVYAPERFASFAAARNAVTFVLGGLSKTCGQPGKKLAWTLVGGPAPEVRETMQRLEWVGDLFLSPSDSAQAAAPELLRRRTEFIVPARARARENEALLRAALAGAETLSPLPVHGGWSAVLRLPPEADEEAWAVRLLERDVLVHPGHFYDFPEGAFLVVSLLCPPAEFAPAAERMAEAAMARNTPAPRRPDPAN